VSSSLLNQICKPYAVTILACVARVSVWFRSKKDRGRRLSTLTAREMKREPKNERVGRGRGRKERFPSFLPHPLPALLLAPFDSCSSFFVPKPHRNACYADYDDLERDNTEMVAMLWFKFFLGLKFFKPVSFSLSFV